MLIDQNPLLVVIFLKKFNKKGQSNQDLRSKRTMQKNSVTSKSEIRKEYLENSHYDKSLQQTFENLNISSSKFNAFCSGNLQKWIAFNLFPEIVELNMVRVS